MGDRDEYTHRSELLAWAQEEVTASINATTPELADLHLTLAEVIRQCFDILDLADDPISAASQHAEHVGRKGKRPTPAPDPHGSQTGF